jgi:hypothetical protein
MSVPAIPSVTEIASVVEAISDVLDVGGAAKAALRAFTQPRLDAIYEQLVEDAKRGKIGAINLYDDPNVGGQIFRLTAAIRQGARVKNIRLLARYLFGRASAQGFSYDDCVEDATIIEALTDSEMRCLAIYKTALDAGKLRIRPSDDFAIPEADRFFYTIAGIDLLGYFVHEAGFRDASVTLQRWGLVKPSATLDVTGFEPTAKLPLFMDRLDLEGIIDI